jgi:polar amino acid transport system substrate-binding protein
MKKLALLLFVLSLSAKTTITVLTEQLPPLNYTDQKSKVFVKNDKITGFSTEVIREIAKRVNTKITVKLMPWARVYKMAQIEKNTAIYSMTRNTKRENMFKWVGPLAKKQSRFYTKKGRKIVLNTLDEAKKYKIATVKDDSKEQFLRDHGFGKLHSLQSVPKWELSLKMVQAGRSDMLISTNFDLPILAQNNGFKATDFEPVLTVQNYFLYIGFSKSTDDSIIIEWQKALDEMKADGTYEKLINKWANKFSANWIYKDGVIQGK